MTGRAHNTKEKLLAAAAEEFSARGIAGARVDRIAVAAGANKQAIYAYFGSKEALFDAVFARRVLEFAEGVQFDAWDLPAYAGRSFDMYEDNPDIVRLTQWYQLECSEGDPLEAIVDSNKAKLADIRRAQREGVLPSDRKPIEVLTVVRSIAMSWHTQIPELAADKALTRPKRRAAVVEAVERVLRGA